MSVVLKNAQMVGEAPIQAGLVISEAAADQAAEWLTLFMSGATTDDDRTRWQQWRTAHPDNERAWQHIEAVTARFKGLQGGAAYRSLMSTDKAKLDDRRKTLILLLGLGLTGAAGVAGSHSQSWHQLTADLSTGVGEQREWILQDGTRLMLNTASAVNVQFDERRRVVRLIAGEVRIVTAHGKKAAGRPFVVRTVEGTVRALGTVFTVRQQNGRTEVAVQESAVEIAPARSLHAVRVLMAGQHTSFSESEIAGSTETTEESVAWLQGRIIANEVRLKDFLAELGRYRRGVVRCDPAVADLRFSGVFPLDDVDDILALLPNSLPVRIRPRSRYWIMVEADPERI